MKDKPDYIFLISVWKMDEKPCQVAVILFCIDLQSCNPANIQGNIALEGNTWQRKSSIFSVQGTLHLFYLAPNTS